MPVWSPIDVTLRWHIHVQISIVVQFILEQCGQNNLVKARYYLVKHLSSRKNDIISREIQTVSCEN